MAATRTITPLERLFNFRSKISATNGHFVKQGAYNISSMLEEIMNAGGVKICMCRKRELKEPVKGSNAWDTVGPHKSHRGVQ